jgi:hypothetical protein
MSSGRTRWALGALLAGLAAVVVLALPAAASARDRNHDRIPDRWEKRHHLSLRVNQAHRDQDHDGLNNRQEFRAGTDPRDADTDNDGIEDGDELAGTIVSFNGTTLVIDRFGAGNVSARVTNQTRIECEAEDAEHGADASRRDDGGNSGPGGGGDDDEANCTRADLVRGAVVAEAELNDAGTVFTEVELA